MLHTGPLTFYTIERCRRLGGRLKICRKELNTVVSSCTVKAVTVTSLQRFNCYMLLWVFGWRRLLLVQWFPGRTNTICRSSCVSALTRGVSNRLLRPVSWHQIRRRCSRPPSPRRWPRCRTFLHLLVCVPELSEPRLHPEGQRKRRGGSDGASMMRYFSKFMYLV